jgi:hypothetical protein
LTPSIVHMTCGSCFGLNLWMNGTKTVSVYCDKSVSSEGMMSMLLKMT